MHKFVRNLLTEWRKLELPFSDETIIVGVSGGADSVSLIVALHDLKSRKKLNLNVVAASFNHHLRGIESDADVEFVRELCGKLQIEFVTNAEENLYPIKRNKGNLEQNARRARYAFLDVIASKHKAYAILTGHTQNDQAETLLLNLIRGSGLDGLAGMRSVGPQNLPDSEIEAKALLVRPLLSWANRSQTEEFCSERGVAYRNDSMNDDVKFSRVRLRKEIFPELEKLNPKLIETLSQTAMLLRLDADELSKISKSNARNITQGSLRLASKPMRLRILRHWLSEQRGNLKQIDYKHLEAIEGLIFSRKSGRIVELPNGEIIIKKDGIIVFEKRRVEKS